MSITEGIASIELSKFDLEECPDRKCGICGKQLQVGDMSFYRFIEDHDFCSVVCAQEADEIDADVKEDA